MRVLLSEGSSLSARQMILALGPTGASIEICDPNPICLGRFSRYVRAWHRCPPWNVDPVGYLRFLASRLETEHYDVLIAVHDQAFLLARFRADLGRRVGLALPDFASLKRVQSKAEFIRVLDELGLPYPPTVLVRTRRELEAAGTPPCYIKLAHSTAGCGVWRVGSQNEVAAVADRLEAAGLLDGRREVLVQQPAAGVLRMIEAVYQHGRLVGAHCSEARAQGVGGSAWARESVLDPPVLQHLASFGTHLDWHGGLCVDYLHDPRTGQPSYIDANPRPGETFNAILSGVNLAECLVKVSLGQEVPSLPPPRPGVRTHTIFMHLMALASDGASRRRLWAELGSASGPPPTLRQQPG